MLTRTPASPGRRTLTFLLPADTPAGRVSVVGNFNDWTPGATPLEPGPEGMASASVTLASDYIACFRYLGENGYWFDEPEADFIDSGASVVLGLDDESAGREPNGAAPTERQGLSAGSPGAPGASDGADDPGASDEAESAEDQEARRLEREALQREKEARRLAKAARRRDKDARAAAKRARKRATKKAREAEKKAERKAAKRQRRQAGNSVDEVRRLADKAQRRAEKLARRLAGRPGDERLTDGGA